jgi:restriction endonuclease S subunit
MKLKNIGTVQTGIYEQPQPFGEVYYIQARHFDNNHQLTDSIKPELPYFPKLENHFLRKGDIIIASKGKDNFSVAYQGKLQPVVASSTFLVIRLQDIEKTIPEYISWYLNLHKTQRILQGNSKGTSLPSITKSDVEDLEIPIPTVIKQELILKIESLMKQEIEIRSKIASKQELIVQQKLSNAIR